MLPLIPVPPSTNKPTKRSRNSPTSGGQDLPSNFADRPTSLPTVDRLNSENIFLNQSVTDTHSRPPVLQVSPERLPFSGPSSTVHHTRTAVPPDTSDIHVKKNAHNETNIQTCPLKFSALIFPADQVVELGEKLSEEENQPPLVIARIAPPETGRKEEIYYLQIMGHNERGKLGRRLYLAFGFTRGYPHHNFSSAVCKAFLLRRREPYLQNIEYYRYSASKLTPPGGDFPLSKVAGILTPSFEQKIRAVYWQGFLKLVSPEYSISHPPIGAGVTIHVHSADSSDSETTPAVVSDGQHTNPQRGFFEPPTTISPRYSHSSLQEVAFVGRQPSSGLLHSLSATVPHWAEQDGQRRDNCSVFPMQGQPSGVSISFTIPAFPAATSDRSDNWVRDRAINLNTTSIDVSPPQGEDSIPLVNHQMTNNAANHDVTYRHVSVAQESSQNNYGQIAGSRFYYPPADLDLADTYGAAISSTSNVLGQVPTYKELEASQHLLPLHSSVPTDVPTEHTEPQRRKRGRPRKQRVNQPSQTRPPPGNPSIPSEAPQIMAPVYGTALGEVPTYTGLEQAPLPPHHLLPPRPSVPGEVPMGQTGPQRRKQGRPRKRKVDQPSQPRPPPYTPSISSEAPRIMASGYNNIATEQALTYNQPPGSDSLPTMTGFPYPLPYYSYHYQQGLVLQTGFTYGVPAAPFNFDFQMPLPPPQFNFEDPPQEDDMEQAMWWDPRPSGGFQ